LQYYNLNLQIIVITQNLTHLINHDILLMSSYLGFCQKKSYVLDIDSSKEFVQTYEKNIMVGPLLVERYLNAKNLREVFVRLVENEPKLSRLAAIALNWLYE